MPFIANVPDEQILSDPTAALFSLSVQVAAHRAQLEAKVHHKALPGYRGTVAAVGERSLSLKTEDGTVKQVSLTAARARQLLEPTTTRK